MGKTTLALAMSRILNLSTVRVQGTPDLHPNDLIGAMIWDKNLNDFRLHKGPIFTELLLFDEINRATPRCQSALLQAMEERQVSIEGHNHKLSEHFTVIATQNQFDNAGTFELPFSQMDRFQILISMGNLNREAERSVLGGSVGRVQIEHLGSIFEPGELGRLKADVQKTPVSPLALDVILDFARFENSEHRELSTRSLLAWVLASKAEAFLEGAKEVLVRHVLKVAPYCLKHRFTANRSDFDSRFSTFVATHGLV